MLLEELRCKPVQLEVESRQVLELLQALSRGLGTGIAVHILAGLALVCLNNRKGSGKEILRWGKNFQVRER